jgi:hypothetical protein
MDNACVYQLTFTSYDGSSVETYLFVSNEEAERKRDLLLKEELRNKFHDMMPEDDASGNLVIRLWPWPVDGYCRLPDLEVAGSYIQDSWKIKALPIEGATDANISALLQDARLKRQREIEPGQ